MKNSANKPKDNEILEVCDELRADDGISPQELEKRKLRSNKKPNYHSRQLCKQVFRAVDEAIGCDCGDPVLNDLRVIDVRRIGKGSPLEVTFVTREMDLNRIAEMQTALGNVSGILRSAVAQSIHRKRVPSLNFRIVPEH